MPKPIYEPVEIGDIVNALVPLGPYSSFPRRAVVRHRYADTVCVFFINAGGARCVAPFVPASSVKSKPELVDFLWVAARDCTLAAI